MPLNREDFGKHACLGSSGYNLLAWAALNSFAALPFYRDISGQGWGALLSAIYLSALAAAGLLLTAINRRRVDKMLASAPQPCECRVRSLWTATVLVCVLLSVAAAASGYERHLPSLWLVCTGAGYLLWGRRSGMPAFKLLALTFLAAVVVTLWLSYSLGSSTAAAAGLALWLACAGVGMASCGIFINRRYLWP